MSTPNNNLSLAPTIYDVSVTILDAQFVSIICWIVAAIIGMIICLLQIATTVLWKPLRKMDQSLIFSLAVADCLKAVAFGTLAARRIYELTTGGNDVGSQLMCMVSLSFMMVPHYAAYFLIIMLSLDRLCGLAFPIWYKNRTVRFRVAQIVLSCVLACCIAAAMFIGASGTKLVPVCAYGTSPTESFLAFVKYFENFCVCFTLGINAMTCIILLNKWRKARGTKQSLTAFKTNVQVGALKMLSSVILVYLITSAASSIFLMILNSSGFSDATRMSYTPISGMFQLLRGVFDFPLYVLLVRDYRNGFREVVLKKLCCGFNGSCSSLHVVDGSSMMGQRSDNGGAGGRRMTRVDACDT